MGTHEEDAEGSTLFSSLSLASRHNKKLNQKRICGGGFSQPLVVDDAETANKFPNPRNVSGSGNERQQRNGEIIENLLTTYYRLISSCAERLCTSDAVSRY